MDARTCVFGAGTKTRSLLPRIERGSSNVVSRVRRWGLHDAIEQRRELARREPVRIAEPRRPVLVSDAVGEGGTVLHNVAPF